MSGDQAWVTLATNDSYALGALVVARSLKRVNTTRKLLVMITPGVSGLMRSALSSEFDVVEEVNVLDSQDAANLALLTRPELGITFTKLHCWRLTQFSKCVFLDADTLILQNCDELFDRNEFSAVPDVGWPDCFNSGVFVFTPSIETFNKLLTFAVAKGSFDGGDQGLLNLYFNDWSVSDISTHLPFIYNMVASATYSYKPAFKVFGANVKIVHFIGPDKPWLMYFDSSTGTVRAPFGQEHLHELLQSWWDIFRADVHNKLSPEMSGLAGAFAKMSLEGAKTDQQIEYEGQMRKHAWEQGHIDYMGKDAFENIMKKLQTSMAQSAPEPEPPVVEAAPKKRKSKSPSPPKPKPPAVAAPQAPAPQVEAVISQAVADIVPLAVAAVVPQAVAPPAPTPEDLEEALLAEERLALEKKLSEQKRIAEQKLQEEKQAAEARAVAAAAAAQAKAAAPPPPQGAAPTGSAPPQAEASAPQPKAPPRRQSKDDEEPQDLDLWRNVGLYRLGLGLSCVIIVVFAIYSAQAWR